MGERICDWAFEGSSTRYVIVRPTNIYGPRDYFDETAHVIPALIRKFSSGKDAVEVFGGNQKREFIYVEDVARGMLAAAEHGQRGEAYNLGTNGGTQVNIRELALTIAEITDFQGHINFVEGAPTGDRSRSTDSGKANALGWDYIMTLESGLQRTVDWWLAQ
jgi:GDP-L-fucose synthase